MEERPELFESGICPNCADPFRYDGDMSITNTDGNTVLKRTWQCPYCGATGAEVSDITFDKHQWTPRVD